MKVKYLLPDSKIHLESWKVQICVLGAQEMHISDKHSVIDSHSWIELGDFIGTCNSPIDPRNIYDNCARKTQKQKVSI